MPYSGPFQYGDRVQLTDAKRRHYTLVLEEGVKFHSHRGIIIEHSQIVGMDEGSVVTSTLGSISCSSVTSWLTMSFHAARRCRDLPERLCQILVEGDIFMGARVLGGGAGSGRCLTCCVRPEGHVFSYEIREDHLEFAENNVRRVLRQQTRMVVPTLRRSRRCHRRRSRRPSRPDRPGYA